MVRSSTAASGQGHTWGRMGDRGTIRDQRLGTVHSQPGNAEPDGRVPAHGHHGYTSITGAVPAPPREVATTRTAAPRLPSGWPIPRPARGGIGIIDDMTATTPHPRGRRASTGNPGTVDGPDRATRAAAARLLTRDAAVHWLTEITVAGIGQAVAVAITRYRPAAGQHPTWAETLAGT